MNIRSTKGPQGFVSFMNDTPPDHNPPTAYWVKLALGIVEMPYGFVQYLRNGLGGLGPDRNRFIVINLVKSGLVPFSIHFSESA